MAEHRITSKGQRLARVHCRHLVHMWLQGTTRHYDVLKGLPADARLVRLFQDHVFETVVLVFESAEWPEMADGEPIPEIRFELWDLREEA